MSLFNSSFFFLMTPRPPISTLFPYTTLFRSSGRPVDARRQSNQMASCPHDLVLRAVCSRAAREQTARRTKSDRKSTRLNSSHLGISYAVFCLKKKKKKKNE